MNKRTISTAIAAAALSGMLGACVPRQPIAMGGGRDIPTTAPASADPCIIPGVDNDDSVANVARFNAWWEANGGPDYYGHAWHDVTTGEIIAISDEEDGTIVLLNCPN